MICKLNLPQNPLNLRKLPSGQTQIYDVLRGKYVALTPEEWVRQNFVNFLIANRQYPAHYMANEVGLVLNGTRRRCDTLIYGHQAEPISIVEYKAPTIAITDKVFDQIVRYNMVLGVGHLMVSNGMSHYCCRINKEAGTYTFLKDIPTYEELKVEG